MKACRQIGLFLFALPWLVAAQVISSPAIGSTGRASISEDSVRHAAAAFLPEMAWGEAAVVVPPEAGTRTANAPLRVVQIRPGRNQNAAVLRIECLQVRECAAFWAEMVFPGPVDLLGVSHSREKARSGTISNAARSPLVRPGRTAALLCEHNGLRISMRVLPLKRASLGETVKVLDPETHRKFLAQVAGVDFLRSDLREAK